MTCLRAGFEPTILRSTYIDSTNEPPRHTLLPVVLNSAIQLVPPRKHDKEDNSSVLKERYLGIISKLHSEATELCLMHTSITIVDASCGSQTDRKTNIQTGKQASVYIQTGAHRPKQIHAARRI